MKIYLNTGGKQIFATLKKSDVALQFAAMLPLKMTMYDLFKREKFGSLSDAFSFPAAAERTRRYEPGDIICWGRGPVIAVFYKQDGTAIRVKFHVLGRIDRGTEIFGGDEPVEVEIGCVTMNKNTDNSKN